MTEERSFPKRFDFAQAEAAIYKKWMDARVFEPAYDSKGANTHPAKKDAETFVIVIPPPNITGRLHMGHALNNTVQDILIRYKRMDGFDALWIPGTDHAGIATQTVVKKQLDAQGIDYRELGREKMIEKIWEWRNQYGDKILEQLKRMGCSCDWSRTRFTMDEGLNRSVRESFVRLYDEGLIYRGKRIVNWCPVDQTALSDDEVEKADEKGKMYRLRYPLEDNSEEYLVVATTRPETMFGDVAVAVHQDDERYKHLIGKKVMLPLQQRLIPIIADEHADPEMGTGCVKITPAHDPNDYEVGLRHDLPQINVMHPDATMNDEVPAAYRGLNRYACRKKVLEDLEAQGLLDGIDDHVLAIGRSYRSKEPIEFRLSDQWFVKMAPMAEEALKASGYERDDQEDSGWRKVREGEVHFHPPHIEKIYFHWLSNIRDWCVSRQIWWGHRIPAWFNKESGEVLVSVETPPEVEAHPEAWEQETDVLDTWCSSWLWPLSTLGWPEHTPDFERYYPTHVLSTAKDILFFWVARMIFAGQRFAGKLPFTDVFLHSTVADERGVTMSKSKGNGIDPLTLVEGASLEDLKQPVMEARPSNMKELLKRIEKNFPEGFGAVGADAMRWTLTYSITEGQHVRLSLSRFTDGRNFATKLWNGAGRVIQTLEQEVAQGGESPALPDLTDEDRWLLARLDSTIRDVRSSLDAFDFGAMAHALYRFVWDDFCSWALELSKPRLESDDVAVRRGALRVMGSVLADMLRLCHPVMPFVTEELWGRLTPAMTSLGLWLDRKPQADLLALDVYPQARDGAQPEIESRFAILQRFVVATRQLRASSQIKDNVKIAVQVKPLVDTTRAMLEQARDAVCFLARIEELQFVGAREKGMAASYDESFEVYVDLSKYIDLAAEVARLDKEIAKAKKDIDLADKKLQNPNFVERAPEEKVNEVRMLKSELVDKVSKMADTREELASL